MHFDEFAGFAKFEFIFKTLDSFRTTVLLSNMFESVCAEKEFCKLLATATHSSLYGFLFRSFF